MKRRFRRRTRVLPFLIVSAVPAAALGLLTLAGDSAKAQTPDKPADTPAVPSGQAAGQPPVQPPGGQNNPPVAGSVISEIIVVGNKMVNAEAIILSSGHKVGDPCTTQTLAEMQESIGKSGYFGQHVGFELDRAVEIKSEEANGKCRVTISVDENDEVKGITVTGSGPIKPEDILKLINKSKVYNPFLLQRDAIAIEDFYKSKGYIAVLGGDAGQMVDGVLQMPIVVTRVAEIKVTGNRKTRRNVILREMQTKEGDFFNVNTFYEDQRRLFNLDLFEQVVPATSDAGNGRILITMSVPEKRTGQILAGVGFSNRSQLIGTAELTDTNFQGTGRTLSLRWEAGGAVGRSSVIFSYVDPWLDRKRTRLDFTLYDRVVFRFANQLNNSLISGNTNVAGTDTRYNEQRTGGSVTLSRPFRRTYVFATTLRGENVRPDPLALTAGNASILQNGPIVSLGFSVAHDTRDIQLDPVTGGFQRANLEVGYADLKGVRLTDGTIAGGAFGKTNFGKLLIESRLYIPLAGKRVKLDDTKSTLALRGYVGAAAGRLPFFEQFFLGGAESLRGYREDRFWGKYVFLASAELRQPLARSLKGVLFFDVGTAWGGSFSDLQLEGFAQSGFRPHAAFGVGLRVNTPIGPLRLDFGYGEEGGRTHISFGNAF